VLELDAATMDRAVGVLLATAAGDALGAGYEGGPLLRPDVAVRMLPGGVCVRSRGEWTDDTAMAWAIAEVVAGGFDLRDSEAQDRLAARWAEWAASAPDVGIHTAAVLSAARAEAGAEGLSSPAARHVRDAATREHERVGRSGGNGSLMRTAPVALAYLGDERGLVEAAIAISALTHPDRTPRRPACCGRWPSGTAC
jgi:ADP-ribosyl-[dinitrogen reductase] hydrolase